MHKVAHVFFFFKNFLQEYLQRTHQTDFCLILQKCSKAIVAGLKNVFVSLILCFMYCICFVYYTDNDQIKRISKDAI